MALKNWNFVHILFALSSNGGINCEQAGSERLKFLYDNTARFPGLLDKERDGEAMRRRSGTSYRLTAAKGRIRKLTEVMKRGKEEGTFSVLFLLALDMRVSFCTQRLRCFINGILYKFANYVARSFAFNLCEVRVQHTADFLKSCYCQGTIF